MILTRESQAVRDSSPYLQRALHLPGLDEPRRLARGTVPPVERSQPVAVPVAAAAPAAPGRSRLLISASLTLVAASVAGLLAAVLGAGL